MKLDNLTRLLVLGGCVFIAMELASQNAPVPPVQGPLPPVLVTDEQETPVIPDEHPLTGGQVLGVGTSGAKHSFIIPSLRLAETLDSNPLLLSSNDGSYRGFTAVGGSVQWMQYVGRDTEIRYSGALRYDSRAELQGYSQFTNVEHVAISRSMRFRNWSLLIDDEAEYSQGSSFGAAGMEGMGGMVTQTSQWSGLSNLLLSPNALRPDLLPDQSVLVGQIGRITNSTLVELDGRVDARNTFTVAGSYGLLHFNSSLLADTDQTLAIAGYNRRVTARDSFAIEGAFARFTYEGSSTSVSTEYFSVLYARRISGRSSIEVGVGPQVTQLNLAQGNQRTVGWQGRGTAQYRTHRTTLSAQANRVVSGGAGVFTGAVTTTGSGTVNCDLSRYFSMSLTSGVSRTQELDSSQLYDMEFAGFVLNRKVGRYSNLYVSYDLQHQTTGGVCTGPFCGYTGLRNVFGIGLSWNYRPISIE